MPVRPNPCDTRRLRLSLEDRLTEGEQADLAAHLEACEPCRLELERLAARSGLWGEARNLRGEPGPGKAPTIGLGTEEGPEDAMEDEAWLAFLEPPDPDRPGTLGRLAAYEVLEVLGRGGMGIVLKARDPALERTVAIKLLTPALAHGPMARRRFAREARAAAAVGHEHIVAIYAVDEFRGLPYLVMQYIPGRSLQDRLDASGPLEGKEILRIGTQAARALAAAHAQGVVHRDIKPANILLENCVERVRLTDFGLARAMDDASLTQSGVIAGTPQYMAPEQARGEPVDARSDLFALGAVLYAMAVGRPPFRANSVMAVLKRICDDRHRSIRELNPDVPDWLESLIDRLLAKDPADRFQTAAEVADLLERGLAHLQQPTVVPRPEIGEVEPHDRPAHEFEFALPVAKAPAPRRRRLATAAGLVMLSLIGLGASEAAGLTSVSDFVATVLRIKTPEGTLEVKVDDPDVKVDVDNECVIIGGAGPREIRLRTGVHRLQATRNGRPVKDELISITKGKKQIVSIVFDPHVAVGAAPVPAAGMADFRWMGTGVAPLPAPADRPMTAPMSHAQQCMACHTGPAALDRPLPANHPPLSPPGMAYMVPGPIAPSPSPAAPAGAAPPSPPVIALAPAAVAPPPPVIMTTPGPSAAAAPSPAPAIAPAAGMAPHPVPPPPEPPTPTGPPTAAHRAVQDARALVWSLAFTPDGRRLAIGQQGIDGRPSPLRLWDLETRKDVFIAGHPAGYRSVALSPDGRHLAAGTLDGILQTCLIQGDLVMADLPREVSSPCNAVCYVGDGKYIAAGCWDGRISFWNVVPGPGHQRLGCPGRVYTLAASPDGKTLAAGGDAGVIYLFDLPSGRKLASLTGHGSAIESLAFTPDGKLLASAGWDQTVRLWHWESNKYVPLRGLNQQAYCVRFSPDGKLVAASGGRTDELHTREVPSRITLWDAGSHKEIRTIEAHRNSIPALAFSPDGKTLASGSMDQTVKLWDVATGQLRETIVPGESGAKSAAGAVDASVRQHRQFNLHDTDSLRAYYEGYVKGQRMNLEKKRAELMALAAKGHVDLQRPRSSAKNDDETPQPLFDKLSIDQYRRTNDQLLRTELDLMEVRSRLPVTGSANAPVELRRQIEALEAKKKSLLELLAKYDVEKQQSSTDTLKARFLNEDINSLTGNIKQVEQKLEQLRFEGGQDTPDMSAITGPNPHPRSEVGPVSDVKPNPMLGNPRATPSNGKGSGEGSLMGAAGTIGSSGAAVGTNPSNEPLKPMPTPAPDRKLKLADELFQKTAELQEAQSQLLSKLTETQADSLTEMDAKKEHLRERIAEEFRRDPQVAALIGQIKATKEELDHDKKMARRAGDPALLAVRERYDNLMEDYDHLWRTRSEQIRKRLLKETGLDSLPDLIRLRPEIEALKQKKSELMKLHDRYREHEGKASSDAKGSTSENSASLRFEGQQPPAEKAPRK